MGCTTCSTGKDGLPGGCKNNGACGTYGCNKLEVFDWLAGMDLPEGTKPFDMVEIRFKNSRKLFYRNSHNLELYSGDVVAVEVSPGYDVGVVSLTGELVRIQMKRKEVKDNYEIKKILRKATEDDITKWQDGRQLEQNTMMRARTIARELGLDMKLSDVEYQGDKTKATFFYTADDRVDFRELIKRYADEFRVRIDMRQIGYRYEAGRLGGIGSCGRELCCSSWLTDFRAVSTSAARYQQLSLNPTKLAGQCGKLKCCLNYELDQYVEATKDFPSVNTRLHLPKGTAYHFKTDIFQRTMYFVYENQPGESPFPLTIEAVRDIMERNRKGIVISDTEKFVIEPEVFEKETDFAEVVGQDSLTRFDKQRGRGGRDNNNKNRGGRNKERGAQGRPQQGAQAGSQQGQPPQQTRQRRPDQGTDQQGQGNKGGQRPQQRGDQPQQQRPPKQGGNPPQSDKPRNPQPPRPKGNEGDRRGPRDNRDNRNRGNQNKDNNTNTPPPPQPPQQP